MTGDTGRSAAPYYLSTMSLFSPAMNCLSAEQVEAGLPVRLLKWVVPIILGAGLAASSGCSAFGRRLEQVGVGRETTVENGRVVAKPTLEVPIYRPGGVKPVNREVTPVRERSKR